MFEACPCWPTTERSKYERISGEDSQGVEVADMARDEAGERGGLLAGAGAPVRCKACGQQTSLAQHGVCLNGQCALAAKGQRGSETEPPAVRLPPLPPRDFEAHTATPEPEPLVSRPPPLPPRDYEHSLRPIAAEHSADKVDASVMASSTDERQTSPTSSPARKKVLSPRQQAMAARFASLKQQLQEGGAQDPGAREEHSHDSTEAVQHRLRLDTIVAQSCADIEAKRSATATQRTPAQPPSVSELRAELSQMSLWEVLGRARKCGGLSMSKVDAAMEGSKPKAAVMSLLIAHETATAPLPEPGARCIDAAKKDDTAGVREAIAMGADLRQAGEDGLTALMHAAAKGRLAALRLLIEGIRTRDPDNVAAGLGVRCSHSGVFAGATALLLAARWGNTPEVVELVQAGANVDAPAVTDGGAGGVALPSPIHLAALHGHAAVVAVLLQAGANSTTLYYGMTPWQWAAHGGYTAVEEVFSLHSAGRA